MTDITISAQMLSVIKTRFGDYNIQRDVIIHNHLTSKWKRKEKKKEMCLYQKFCLPNVVENSCKRLKK